MTLLHKGIDVDVAIIETSGLGDRSYLISADGIAVVVDPQRDIDRVLDLARERGVRISHVLETHIHNDYVTGGLELSRTCATAPPSRPVTSAAPLVSSDIIGQAKGLLMHSEKVIALEAFAALAKASPGGSCPSRGLDTIATGYRLRRGHHGDPRSRHRRYG